MIERFFVYRLGGLIVDMAWDPSGKLLAVLFKDGNLIPVFSTIICARPKVLQLTPRYGCFAEAYTY